MESDEFDGTFPDSVYEDMSEYTDNGYDDGYADSFDYVPSDDDSASSTQASKTVTNAPKQATEASGRQSAQTVPSAQGVTEKPVEAVTVPQTGDTQVSAASASAAVASQDTKPVTQTNQQPQAPVPRQSVPSGYDDYDSDVVVPTAKDYEKFLLSTIIYGNAKERMLDVMSIIPASKSDYFTFNNNRTIYSVLCDLSNADSMPADPTLITEELWSRIASRRRDYNCSFNKQKDVARYVYSMSVERLPGMDMDAYKEYAERVKWAHEQREYKRAADAIASKALATPFSEREDFITETETRINNLSLEVRNSDGLREVTKTTDTTRDRLRTMRDWKPIEMGLMTGFDALDRTLGGINPGELIILAGATGAGKSLAASNFMMSIAGNPDPKKRRSVMMFSLEMMDSQLTERAIASIARVNVKGNYQLYDKVVSGEYERLYGRAATARAKDVLRDQQARLLAALDYYESLPIYTDITPGVNANEIKSMVLAKQREVENTEGVPPVGLIIVDYLQIMSPVDGSKAENRTNEVGDMSRRLKRLAKETGIPVLCLAQLNRAAADGEQPSLSNLRESGSIEQDADKVIFVWQPARGKKEDSYASEIPNGEDAIRARRLMLRKDQMKMKMTVAKNRSGEQGTCDLIGDFDFQLFVGQSDEYLAQRESFDEFFEKYYLKTRSGQDLFWPILPGHCVDPELERQRRLRAPELPYIGENGNVITSAGDGGVASADRGGTPGISQTRTYDDGFMPDDEQVPWDEVDQAPQAAGAGTDRQAGNSTAGTASAAVSAQVGNMTGRTADGVSGHDTHSVAVSKETQEAAPAGTGNRKATGGTRQTDDGGARNTKGRGSDGMSSFRPRVVDDVSVEFADVDADDDVPLDLEAIPRGVNDGNAPDATHSEDAPADTVDGAREKIPTQGARDEKPEHGDAAGKSDGVSLDDLDALLADAESSL